MPTFASLFTGPGGMDLGLERAGWECRWQVEIDPFRRALLEKRWPKVPKYADVREVGAHNLEPVTLLAGGFPCKGVSPAGLRTGLEHPESALWHEYARIIGELRPRFVIVENSSDLLTRGLENVLAGLAGFGFDAEWSVVSACSMGAPHTRRRLFVVAYPTGSYEQDESSPVSLALHGHSHWQGKPRGSGGDSGRGARWLPEPPLDRVAVGVPSRVVRPQLGALGSVVLPRVAEYIGRGLMEVA